MFTFAPIDLRSYDPIIYDTVKFSENSVLMRFPGEHGHGKAYAVEMLSINGSAEQKDLCWDFVKFMLNYEKFGQVRKITDASGFPIKKSIFEIKNKIEGLYTITGYTTVYDLDQKHKDFVTSYISDIGGHICIDGEIDNVIYTETEALFNGTATADEVAKKIQNRVELYSNE